MKRILFLLLLLTSCYSVERNCVDFKTGVFEFSTSVNDSIITSTFTRTNNYEIETQIFKNCEHRIPTEGSSLGLQFIKKHLY